MQERNQLQNAKMQDSAPYQRMHNPEHNYPQNQNILPPSQNRVQEYAANANQLKPQSSSCHCQALVATIFLITGLAIGIIAYLSSNGQVSQGGMISICFGSYILYLIVACCCNPLSQYLSNIRRGQNFQDQYQALRRKVGHFVFDVVCYHYETRHHTRTVQDSDGNSTTQHYTTTEKVITHTASEKVYPRSYEDESGSIDQIRAATQIVFIHYYFKYRFDSLASEMNFLGLYNNFKRRHSRDEQNEFHFKYEYPDIIERKTYFIGELNCEYECWYYVSGMFGMLWLYSLWVQSKISRFRVDFMKVLTF